MPGKTLAVDRRLSINSVPKPNETMLEKVRQHTLSGTVKHIVACVHARSPNSRAFWTTNCTMFSTHIHSFFHSYYDLVPPISLDLQIPPYSRQATFSSWDNADHPLLPGTPLWLPGHHTHPVLFPAPSLMAEWKLSRRPKRSAATFPRC